MIAIAMIGAAIAAATVAFPAMASTQATLTVGPSGTYKTIQSAVNAASAGDTILVQSGTYNENVVLDKAVTLKAAAGATPIVDAGARYPAFRVHAADWIEGFTVRNGGSSYSGFYVSGSSATIVNNKISGCGWGVFVTGGSGNTIKGNTVTGAASDGIGLSGSNKNTVTGNVVTGCGKGLSIEGSSSGNTIYFNDFNNGASVSGVTNTFGSPSALAYSYKGTAYPAHVLGNFWGDYKSTDANGNGLGDAVYRAGGITDSYPLIASIASFALDGAGSPSPTPDPTATPAPTGRPSVTPVPTGTPSPTGTPAPTGTPRPTVTPAPTATPKPTATPAPNTGGSWAPGSYGVDQAGINGGPGQIYINPAVPSGATPVSSQSALSALPGGANAVLTADLSSLTVDKAINLYGNGHTVTSVTISAKGARVSGVKSASIKIAADSVTVDHCTVTATNTAGAIIASHVSSPSILSNTVNAVIGSIDSSGCSYTTSFGITVTNCTSPIVDGNSAYNGYYNIYMAGCSNVRVSYNDIPDATRKGRGIEMYFESINGGRINNNQIENYPYLGPGDTGANINNHDGLGARYLDGVTLDHNKVLGHYYPFKVYQSNNCVLEYNQVTGGGFGIRIGFWSTNLLIQWNQLAGDTVHMRSVGIYVGDGCKDCNIRWNEVYNNQYGVEMYSYSSYHLNGAAPSPNTNITFQQDYLHGNSVLFYGNPNQAGVAPNTYTILPSNPAGLTNPTPTPTYSPH